MSNFRLVLASLCVVSAALSVSAQTRSFLKTNEHLGVKWGDSRGNEYLVSPAKNFHAYITYGGRFAIYKGPSPSQSYGMSWQIPNHKCCVNFLIQQSDGNLVEYLGNGPSDNLGWVWGSQTTAGGGVFYAMLQDDGNLCVNKGTGPADNRGHVWCAYSHVPVTWASGTGYFLQNGSGRYLHFAESSSSDMAVSMQDSRGNWTFVSDGTLRWSRNNRCLQFDPANGVTRAVACNGSQYQKGWHYQTSDQTIRNTSYPNACLTAGSSPLYAASSPVANFRTSACVSGAASTWSLIAN